MTLMIVGPTCSGKSHLIASQWFRDEYSAFAAALDNKRYAFDLGGGNIPNNALIHYNLLHGLWLKRAVVQGTDTGIIYKVGTEPIFRKIIDSGVVNKAIVLVAPEHVLIDRASSRTVIEEDLTSSGAYSSKFLSDVVS